jgi:hypothetical protein
LLLVAVAAVEIYQADLQAAVAVLVVIELEA